MLPRPSADDARGELLFVSYSRQDAVWAQRFEVLLKPLLGPRLRLWTDRALRAGDEWRPEIAAAIARSTSALLLVSADFLASDFVMDHELPALLEHRVRLLPVLVGDCLWQAVPALADVQWLHDPERAGPLNRVAHDDARRDELLAKVCRKLVDTGPGTGAGPVGPAPIEAATGDASASAGFGVPDHPPGYVVRDELKALVEAVTDAAGGSAPLGLVGPGGVGKSVLAAALGRDHRVRRRFPDGVFWVPLGERPDVLAVQLGLLSGLGAAGSPPRTIHEATDRLRDLLAERRVLLVVDDVWSAAAALAFRVAGARGRVVLTTRERPVVAAEGACEWSIGPLSPAAALAVGAAVLGIAADALPAAADRAFAQVGRVALAVALLAAAVRGGRSWDAVVDDLRGEVDVWGDHPYANAFKAMQIAVAALPAELVDPLLGLAVFPRDTTVPVAAVRRYWTRTRGPGVDTSGDLDRLAAANLLRREGEEIGFHDLQHDYLLLHAPGLPVLHAELLAAYATLLPDGGRDGWWQLPPDEPYVWEHLVAHLAGAGERRLLTETVTDPPYLARRIRRSGLHAAEADLARAAAVAPEHDLVAWWQWWLARHAPFLATPQSARTESVGPTMLAWLRFDPTRPAQVDPERLQPVLPSPYLAVRWGLASREPALVRGLTGHRRPVFAVDWSPDGALIAAGSVTGEVRLWNARTGDPVVAFRTGHSAVRAVSWAPDGQLLAVVTPEQTTLWDAEGKLLASLPAGYEVSDLTWSPVGDRLAVIGTATSVSDLRFVGAVDGGLDECINRPELGFTGVAWSADARSVATATWDGAVVIWDAATRRPTGSTRQFDWDVAAMAWAPSSHTLAVASGSRVHLWQLVDGTEVVLSEGTDTVTAVAWSGAGDRLATGSGRDVRVWDLASGGSVRLGGHTVRVHNVAWSADGTRLATAGGDNEVQVWDTAPASGTAVERASHWIDGIAVSRVGDQVAALHGEYPGRWQSVRIQDGATGRSTAASDPVFESMNALAWSPDERSLLVAGSGRDAHESTSRWQPDSGEITSWDGGGDGHDDRYVVAWTAAGPVRLAVAFPDGVEVWDDQWDAPTTFSGRGTVALAWCADGRQLAASCTTSTGGPEIVVWHVDERRVRARLRLCPALALAWSPDSARLAVAEVGRPLILWEPATGTTTTLPGRLDVVTGVVWAPDGRHVLTTEEDGAVTVHPVDGTAGSSLQLTGATCVAWSGATIAVGQRTGVAVLELVQVP